ncbi:MAG TPA: porin family protein [Ignavibacteria bacterium]|nr:porin family protein [Ignavibacteria bacterium]HRJ98194.1 porin family protein [Ignavibacteria bacterium]
MKNLVFLVLLFVVLLFSSESNAQVKVSLGLEAGINIANTTQTPDANTNSKVGMIAGGVLELGLSKQISIVPGIRYVMKGNSFTTNNVNVDNKGNFLQFPALLKVKFPLTEIKPYLIAGPILGILLSSTQDQSTSTQSASFDTKANFETTEFSLLFGGGLDFKVATTTDLFFQFGYELGLSNISKVVNQTIKTNGIQITAGAKFGL